MLIIVFQTPLRCSRTGRGQCSLDASAESGSGHHHPTPQLPWQKVSSATIRNYDFKQNYPWIPYLINGIFFLFGRNMKIIPLYHLIYRATLKWLLIDGNPYSKLKSNQIFNVIECNKVCWKTRTNNGKIIQNDKSHLNKF